VRASPFTLPELVIVSVPLLAACCTVLAPLGWSVCGPDATSGTAALLPSLSVTVSVSVGVRANVTGPLPVTCVLPCTGVPSYEALSR
jgi:hypothetical protein